MIVPIAHYHSVTESRAPGRNWQRMPWELIFFWERKYKVSFRTKALKTISKCVHTLKASNSTPRHIPTQMSVYTYKDVPKHP